MLESPLIARVIHVEEQRTENREQRAKNKEQRTENKEQRTENRAEIRECLFQD